MPGVTDVISGFTGGARANPTYNGDHQGHYEAIEVSYDASRISYQDLLEVFWTNIDPFDARGQFCDRGSSYRSALFTDSPQERQWAQISKRRVSERFPGQQVVTPILDRKAFYPVENHHQDYFIKHALRYRIYRACCGRDRRLRQIWGDVADH